MAGTVRVGIPAKVRLSRPGSLVLLAALCARSGVLGSRPPAVEKVLDPERYRYDAATCPVDFVVRRNANGLGHRMSVIVFAIDAARKLGAALYLDDDYWTAGDSVGREEDYTPVWSFLKVPPASASPLVQAGTTPVKLTVSDVLFRGPTLPCGSVVDLNAGNSLSCTGTKRQLCFHEMEGVFARRVKELKEYVSYDALTRIAAPESNRTEGHAVGRAATLAPVPVVWHLRYGDIRVPVNEAAMRAVKERIDAGLGDRPADHVVYAGDSHALLKDHGALMTSLDFRLVEEPDAIRTFVAMVQAPVLVSTGSSFAHMAAAVAAIGKQAHFFFPPKGSRKVCTSASKCRKEGQNDMYHVHYFPTNTVPLADDGFPFPGYEAKEKSMLYFLARDGTVPTDLADMNYELWL